MNRGGCEGREQKRKSSNPNSIPQLQTRKARRKEPTLEQMQILEGRPKKHRDLSSVEEEVATYLPYIPDVPLSEGFIHSRQTGRTSKYARPHPRPISKAT